MPSIENGVFIPDKYEASVLEKIWGESIDYLLANAEERGKQA